MLDGLLIVNDLPGNIGNPFGMIEAVIMRWGFYGLVILLLSVAE
jgi:hypothetical protein